MLGPLGTRNPQKEAAVVRRFVSLFQIVSFDQVSAERHALLRHDLQQIGLTLGAHDLIVAATAIAHSLTLVTHDQVFQRAPGLIFEDWEGNP